MLIHYHVDKIVIDHLSNEDNALKLLYQLPAEYNAKNLYLDNPQRRITLVYVNKFDDWVYLFMNIDDESTCEEYSNEIYQTIRRLCVINTLLE
jgi:hypothetical protein